MFALLLIGMLAAESSVPLADPVNADQVLVVKSQRILTLLSQGKVIRTYKVALGGTPVGAKEQQGDHKTPEGRYVLDRRNSKSRFYKSIHVSYPNEQDQQKAAKNGTSSGGDVMIHGLPNGFGWLGATHRAMDWTDGCIVNTYNYLDLVPKGRDEDGLPFPMAWVGHHDRYGDGYLADADKPYWSADAVPAR